MDVDDDSILWRSAWLIGKSARGIWYVLLTIILIITIMYGVILNTFDSQIVAVVVSALLLAGIAFMSMVDVKEEKDRFDNARGNGKNKVDRVSSRRK